MLDPQSWKAILLYSVCLVAVVESIYLLSKSLMGSEGAIHIEVLLPAASIVKRIPAEVGAANRLISKLLSHDKSLWGKR